MVQITPGQACQERDPGSRHRLPTEEIPGCSGLKVFCFEAQEPGEAVPPLGVTVTNRGVKGDGPK